MIAKQPRGPGSHSAERSASGRLAQALRKFHWHPGPRASAAAPPGCSRSTPIPECQRPDAPADLPTIHGLQLAAIEARLLKLEQQVSNQNRILLIGVIAVVGDLAGQLLKP